MRNLYSVTALVLLAILFLALTLLSGTALRGLRLDLTEQGLYTLSDGSIRILRSLEDPITLSLYFSEANSADLPQLRNFANRVQELLDEMSQQAGGKLQVRRIDPEPFSEAEERAAAQGLEAVPITTGGDTLYLGIVGTNLLDGLEVLPFLAPAREEFLEYDLMRMVHLLSRADKPAIGLLDGLGMGGGLDFQSGQQLPAWVMHDQIHEHFDVQMVRPGDEQLPEGMDLLVLVHPQQLAEALLVDIEAFLADGGRLLALVDPWAENAEPEDPTDVMAVMNLDRSSGLEPLFAAWGLEFDQERFVADAGLGLQVSMGQQALRHVGILGVHQDYLNSDDVVTGELNAVNLASAGHLRLAPDSPLELEPLMQSSGQADLLDTARLQFLSNPMELLDQMGSTGEHYVLAARLGGRVPTMASAEAEEAQDYALNAIVVADVDFLADLYWVSQQQFFGTVLLEPFADNGEFVLNAIENLLGDANLISVRARPTSVRPFTLVDALRREAERDLRATEQRLEAELNETEQRLSDLQQARGDSNLNVLSDAQADELNRFMERRLEIRRELRQVRHQLDADIQALGRRVKLLNILLMPGLVTLLALGLAAYRRRRAAQAREAHHARA